MRHRHQDKDPWSFPHRCFDTPSRTWTHWIDFLKWGVGAIILVLVLVQVAYAEVVAETGAGDTRLTLTTEPCSIPGLRNQSSAWKAILRVQGALSEACWGFYKYGEGQVVVYVPELPKPYVLELSRFRPINEWR